MRIARRALSYRAEGGWMESTFLRAIPHDGQESRGSSPQERMDVGPDIGLTSHLREGREDLSRAYPWQQGSRGRNACEDPAAYQGTALMKDFSYPAKIAKTRAGVFDVRFLDFKEAFTEGDTLNEALEHATEVLSGVILARLAHEKPLPKPRTAAKGRDIYHVLPDAKTQSALVVRAAIKDQ